jgi:four helix bundle protein
MIEITIMTVDKYEDLRIWKESRDLNLEIYLLAKESELGKDFGLWNQLNRSLGSVMDNIAEGFERDGNAEFIQALSVAKKQSRSCTGHLIAIILRSTCLTIKPKRIN